MFNSDVCIELRVLGPEGKPFIDLGPKYSTLFAEHGADLSVPLLFSSSSKTSVVVAIGIGVITGTCTYLVQKLIDEIFFLQEEQPYTEIHITIQNGDNYFVVEGDKAVIIQRIEELRESNVK